AHNEQNNNPTPSVENQKYTVMEQDKIQQFWNVPTSTCYPPIDLRQLLLTLDQPPKLRLTLDLNKFKIQKPQKMRLKNDLVFCGFSEKILRTAKRKNAKQTVYDRYMNCFS